MHITTRNIRLQIIHHIFYCLAEMDAYQSIKCFILTPVMTLKNKSDSDYVQNWQNAMKEDYSKIRQNNKILQENSKSNYDKKIFGSTLTPGERVLLKNLSERGEIEKLKSYWDNDIYEVVSCHP